MAKSKGTRGGTGGKVIDLAKERERAEVRAELRQRDDRLRGLEQALSEKETEALAMLRKGGLDAELAAGTLATLRAKPIMRCMYIERELAEWKLTLADAATKPEERRRIAGRIDAMWKVYGSETEAWGDMVRRLASDVSMVALLHGRHGAATGRSLFAVYGWTLSASEMHLLDECASLWGRKAGKPLKRDTRRSKWEALADLVEAMGFGHVDPESLQRECRRSP